MRIEFSSTAAGVKLMIVILRELSAVLVRGPSLHYLLANYSVRGHDWRNDMDERSREHPASLYAA